MTLGVIESKKQSRVIGGAMQLIQAITPIVAATSCTFTNIPQNFNHLFVQAIARSSYSGGGNDLVVMQLNGDGGSNYCLLRTEGSGSSLNAYVYATQSLIYLGAIAPSTASAGYSSTIEIEIPYYTNTTFYKVIFDKVDTSATQDINTSCYVSLNPVTSIKIYSNSSSNFTLGSQFFLYGIT